MSKRVLALVVAVSAFMWLISAVNALGDDATRGAALMLQPQPFVEEPVSNAPSESSGGFEAGGGLDLVDMYQCTWGPPIDDISQWVGWWLIAAAFGGVPVAYLIRSSREMPT